MQTNNKDSKVSYTKKYRVNIDMTWSEDINVSAKSMTEAKNKAWEKFKNKIPKKNFTLLADKIN